MATVFNIRGTNGSGKTTLARAFLPPNLRGDAAGGPVDLSWYESPTKKDPDRLVRYEGYVRAADHVLVLGKYTTACGGMDKHPAGKGFVVPQEAIWWALGNKPDGHPSPMSMTTVDTIICEGVLASGVYGSWHDFALALQGDHHDFAFVYLHTPVDVCLERIRDRQREAGKEPALPGTAEGMRLVENVTGKWRGTMATRRKAIADGHLVYDIPHGTPQDQAFVMGHLVNGDAEIRSELRAR